MLHIWQFWIRRFFMLSLICKTGSCFDQFDDNSLLKIDWPGRIAKAEEILEKFAEHALHPDDAIIVSSVDHERFVCKLPDNPRNPKGHLVEYFGPTPKELIKTLYDQRSCTYRIDLYWTYEFCHGQYLLQYHEEKELRRTSRQEYYLGQYIPELDKSDDGTVDYITKPPKRKVDDQMVPYYAVEYSQGTFCDITGQPRRTTVHYICDFDAKSQILSFDEISSCEYELVVATPKLCTHPGFKHDKTKEHKIECYPADQDSPPTPYSLTLWEREQKWLNMYRDINGNKKTKLIIPFLPKNIDFDAILDEISRRSRPAINPTNQHAEADTIGQNEPIDDKSRATVSPTRPPADQSMAKAFLAGEQCLYGGEGWWKYEYCHMRHVVQYHADEVDGSTTTKVLLGLWKPAAHSDWINLRPHKKPFHQSSSSIESNEKSIIQVSNYYTGGDTCEETGKGRTVEVRLKCKKSDSLSLNAVSLYLLEPRTCEYVLGVETAMICDALQTADEEGVLKQ